jgi:(heptosyl)LPS beta-1,4-glucosyltransferase
MLSAIVITKNEEQMVGDCLTSLSFADEILVVDTGNTDSTNFIAKRLGAQIIPSTGTNYSQFRQDGLTKARGDWVLYIDADERVGASLRTEILMTMQHPQGFTAFAIPRENIYLGKIMHFGGWGEDYVIRLFTKNNLHGWIGVLHEQPDYTGSLEKLTQKLTHISHRDLSSMVAKTLNFTAYEAKLRFDNHHPQITWWRIFRVMITELWFRFVKLSAWRDGPRGIIDGIFQVFNTFIIYARLWELQYESRGL